MAAHSYDLVIVGAGSGNMLPAGQFAGWRMAIVEADRFGGTCLNRGCIPSKMLVYTADVVQTVRHAGCFGIGAEWGEADCPAIRDRILGRIDPLHDRAIAHRRTSGIDVFSGEARFAGPKILRVGEDELSADRFVLATGSRPRIPPVSGLAGVPYLTSDTVMRPDTLPRSMVVLGGGSIAAEMSHIFGSLGTAVTIIERGSNLLSRHDADIRARFTEHYRERFDLRLNSAVARVSPAGTGVRLDLGTSSGAQRVEAEALLVATGRRPNSEFLDVAAAGIDVDTHGHVRTDDTRQTRVPGIWALGDLANHFQLKHMADAEAQIVWHNIAHPGPAPESGLPGRTRRSVRRSAGRLRWCHRAGPPSTRTALCGGRPARTATPPTAGRCRTPQVSRRSSPTPTPACCSGPTSSARKPRSSSSPSSRRCASGTPSMTWPPAFSTFTQRSPKSSSRRCSNSKIHPCS